MNSVQMTLSRKEDKIRPKIFKAKHKWIKVLATIDGMEVVGHPLSFYNTDVIFIFLKEIMLGFHFYFLKFGSIPIIDMYVMSQN